MAANDLWERDRRHEQRGQLVPNFDCRYLTEDVPFGLVPTRALAEIADIETPAIDEVIAWAQSVMHGTYWLVTG
jgi:opine dehydrogenase